MNIKNGWLDKSDESIRRETDFANSFPTQLLHRITHSPLTRVILAHTLDSERLVTVGGGYLQDVHDQMLVTITALYTEYVSLTRMAWGYTLPTPSEYMSSIEPERGR